MEDIVCVWGGGQKWACPVAETELHTRCEPVVAELIGS